MYEVKAIAQLRFAVVQHALVEAHHGQYYDSRQLSVLLLHIALHRGYQHPVQY